MKDDRHVNLIVLENILSRTASSIAREARGFPDQDRLAILRLSANQMVKQGADKYLPEPMSFFGSGSDQAIATHPKDMISSLCDMDQGRRLWGMLPPAAETIRRATEMKELIAGIFHDAIGFSLENLAAGQDQPAEFLSNPDNQRDLLCLERMTREISKPYRFIAEAEDAFFEMVDMYRNFENMSLGQVYAWQREITPNVEDPFREPEKDPQPA